MEVVGQLTAGAGAIRGFTMDSRHHSGTREVGLDKRRSCGMDGARHCGLQVAAASGGGTETRLAGLEEELATAADE